MRFHERPVRSASSIFLLEILSDKHCRGWYRRISHPPDTDFSRHHVSTSQTQAFANSRFKNTAIYFPTITDFFTSGEVGLTRVLHIKQRGKRIFIDCVDSHDWSAKRHLPNKAWVDTLTRNQFDSTGRRNFLKRCIQTEYIRDTVERGDDLVSVPETASAQTVQAQRDLSEQVVCGSLQNSFG